MRIKNIEPVQEYLSLTRMWCTRIAWAQKGVTKKQDFSEGPTLLIGELPFIY